MQHHGHALAHIIVMMNFNCRSSQGHHGLKCRELKQHAHSRGSHAFTHTYINTVTTTSYMYTSAAGKFSVQIHMKWNMERS